MIATTTTADRITALEAERRGAIRRYLDILVELAAPLAILVAADAELRAAMYAAGSAPPPGRDVRSLAAEALLGAAQALRPSISGGSRSTSSAARLTVLSLTPCSAAMVSAVLGWSI